MPTALSRPWSSNYTPSTGNSGYQHQTCTSPSSSSSSFISQGGNLINWRGGVEEMIQLRAHLSTLLFSSSSANSYLKYHYSDWPLPVKEQQEAAAADKFPINRSSLPKYADEAINMKAFARLSVCLSEPAALSVGQCATLDLVSII